MAAAEVAVKRIHTALPILMIAAVLATLSCGGSESKAAVSAVSEAVTSHREVQVHWEKDWEAAFKRARAEHKPVLVSFGAEWCVWCKHLDTITYKDAEVARILADRVVPLEVDIDHAKRELLVRHRIEAPPTIVVLTDDGRELGRIPGYMPPAGFLKTIEGILGQHAS